MKSRKNINKNIGNVIKTLRKTTQTTQKMLADYLDVSVQQVHKYESGIDSVNFLMIKKISNFFGCNIETFLPEEQNQNSSILKIAEKKNILNNKKSKKNDDAVLLLKQYFSLDEDGKKKILEIIKTFPKKDI